MAEQMVMKADFVMHARSGNDAKIWHTNRDRIDPRI